ncbi:hypothetical protein BCR36DRAFT_349491 [Piromyces finnis]|uniref:Uncharacterized protein n=1 Tax=Piromyces finnis TaxID=1754191 RepID=A0A1Y1VCH0_9FUNG|nr:hypothetical protein BCR36DRAFT_349491 [Piromyces finnis]|eukprot:ORX52885.1 hypothetical protein BCR36DRAFT_349491 [Piromyces finnis]
MSEDEKSYRNPSPPPNYDNSVNESISLKSQFPISNENENYSNFDSYNNKNNEMNDNDDELYHLYQQIIVFFKTIINLIEQDKVDDDCSNDDDNELQKILCFLWDITCQEENAKLVVNCIESSISIFLKLMTITKMERTQELCLGILGNIACFESLYHSLYENEVLITIIGMTFSTSMDPEVLFSCCRIIKNLILGFCKLNYLDKEKDQKDRGLKFHKAFFKCFQTYAVDKKIFFILENSLHNNLLKEVLDIIYLLYSTVFLKEYTIFYIADQDILNKDENEKIKNAQYHLDIFKNNVDLLLQFLHKNINYLNREKRKKNGIVDKNKNSVVPEKTQEEDEQNNVYHSCRIFFETFESKMEVILSLLKIVYTLLKNNNLLMTDDIIQHNIIVLILEWIHLTFNEIPNKNKEFEPFSNDNNDDEDDEEDSILFDTIEISFQIINCYIQNHQRTHLHQLFFHPNDKYDINTIVKCLIIHCIPKETGWKILKWIAQEIKYFVQELYSNLINLKNNNTKLVVQSVLLNHFELLKNEENKIDINPKIPNQDKIYEILRSIISTMAYYSSYYTKGIEQDAEETYGDVKQRIIQKRLFQLLEEQVEIHELKTDPVIKYIKEIIHDKEVIMNYNEKAYQLEKLIVHTCCLLLSLDEVYKIINEKQETGLNFEPIHILLSKLWES